MSQVLKTPVPFKLKRLLLQDFREVKLPRGTTLLSPGMEVRCAWLLRRGMVKHYGYTRQGEQDIYHFYQPGDILVMEEAFLMQKRAKRYFETLDEAVLIPISHLQFEQARQHYPQLLLLPLLQLLLASKKRVVTRNKLLQCTAEERYRLFVKLFPAQLLLARDVAAYLHLTPSSLSRIKSRG